jgi:hypothetical protein
MHTSSFLSLLCTCTLKNLKICWLDNVKENFF